MARKGITYDQVANAATVIKAQGSEPTITAIRNQIGEGSFSTISAHLAKWREESADKVNPRDLPPEVEAKIMEAMTVIWNISDKAAQEDLAAIRREHKEREDELNQALKEANEEIARLESAVEKEEEKNEAMASELEKLKSENTATLAKLEAYKEIAGEPKPPAGKKTVRRPRTKAASECTPDASQPG